LTAHIAVNSTYVPPGRAVLVDTIVSRRKRESGRGSVRVMSITWTYDASGLAYISLTDQRPGGFVRSSVDLGALAEDEGIESLHSIVLDFDADGRLVGIEIQGNAEAVLPRDLLAEHGYGESKDRRSV
jgi:uncharacterized protein YuzE